MTPTERDRLFAEAMRLLDYAQMLLRRAFRKLEQRGEPK